MIEHLCRYKHSTFSTNPGAVICISCKSPSYPVVTPLPKQVISQIQLPKPIPSFVQPKQKSLCVCGKEKSEKAKHCMACASALKKKKPIEAFLPPQTPREKSRYDWVADTRRKIALAEKNIERWKGMIAQHEKMNAQKKENDGTGR